MAEPRPRCTYIWSITSSSVFETNEKHDYHKISIYLRIVVLLRQTHTHTSSFHYIICNCHAHLRTIFVDMVSFSHQFIIYHYSFSSSCGPECVYVCIQQNPKSRWYLVTGIAPKHKQYYIYILKTDTFGTINGKLLI